MESLRLFFSAWEIFAHPTLAGVVAGALLGVCGVWIVLRRMVFLSATLSQTAGFGVVLALWAQAVGWVAVAPIWGAVGLTIVSAVVVSRVRGIAEQGLSVLYLLSASGTLLVASQTAGELADVDALLFGSAVAVLPEDFRTMWVAAVVLLVLHAWLWRGFAALLIDRDGAQVRGLPTSALEITLSVLLAVAIAVTTYVLGALPAFAFSVLPALAALAVASSLPGALILASVIGALSGGLGYVAAFVWDLPVGAAQTAVALVFWVGFSLVRKVLGR